MYDRQTYRDAVRAGWPFGVALFLAEEIAFALLQHLGWQYEELVTGSIPQGYAHTLLVRTGRSVSK